MGEYLGVGAALSAALLWAVAVAMYEVAGRHLPPVSLNLAKSVVAIVLFGLTLGIRGAHFDRIGTGAFLALALSGIIGLAVSDTFFFIALNRLGTRLSLLFLLLAPPLTAVLARVSLSERLGLTAWAGIALTLAGIGWVICERSVRERVPRDRLAVGVVCGVLVSLCWATGSVLSRGVFRETDVDPLHSAVIRLAAAMAVLLPMGIVRGERAGTVIRAMNRYRLWRVVLPAAFTGTFLGVWLQQVALDNAAAGIAQTLLATSPLFGVGVVAVTGEKVTWRAVVGCGVAFAGVALLAFRTTCG